MENKKIINKLKKECVFLLEKSKTKKNEKDIQLYSTILEILSSENAFSKMDIEVSLNILLDLGYTSKDALKIYNQLINN